jgi:hypothetical protein
LGDGNGAMMIRKDASKAEFLKKGGHVVGRYTSAQGGVTLYGSIQFDDLIGKM